jgi:hypothetical protein
LVISHYNLVQGAKSLQICSRNSFGPSSEEQTKPPVAVVRRETLLHWYVKDESGISKRGGAANDCCVVQKC